MAIAGSGGPIEGGDFGGSVVPFARRWHVIDEIDLVRLIAHHARLRKICGALEAVADALPARPAPSEAAGLCRDFDWLLVPPEAREATFLAKMFADESAGLLTRTVVRQIRHRHAANRIQAEDLVAALAPTDPDTAMPADLLGYMLRGFFDGCRRAMEYELLAILALGHARLTQRARALLTENLAQAATG